METKNDVVCINIREFEELACSSEQLEILRTAYRSMDMYAFEHVLDAVFGVENKYKGDYNG